SKFVSPKSGHGRMSATGMLRASEASIVPPICPQFEPRDKKVRFSHRFVPRLRRGLAKMSQLAFACQHQKARAKPFGDAARQARDERSNDPARLRQMSQSSAKEAPSEGLG